LLRPSLRFGLAMTLSVFLVIARREAPKQSRATS
jgi:hypothetical protein